MKMSTSIFPTPVPDKRWKQTTFDFFKNWLILLFCLDWTSQLSEKYCVLSHCIMRATHTHIEAGIWFHANSIMLSYFCQVFSLNISREKWTQVAALSSSLFVLWLRSRPTWTIGLLRADGTNCGQVLKLVTNLICSAMVSWYPEACRLWKCATSLSWGLSWWPQRGRI